MISVELPLFTRNLLMLNPSIVSMMTRGSSYGCFTPLASSFKKTMFTTSLFLCFVCGIIWTQLTDLFCDFLRHLKKPPIIRPPLIILTSNIASFGRSCGLSSSLGLSSILVRFSCFGVYMCLFLRNSAIFLSRSTLLSVLWGLSTRQCNARALNGNGNTFSCFLHYVNCLMAWPSKLMVVLNLHQDLVNRHYQGCKVYHFLSLFVLRWVIFSFPLLPFQVILGAWLGCSRFAHLYCRKSILCIRVFFSLYKQIHH